MDTSRFIICRAAAGSGKTYTLVRQYLSLAFDAPEGRLGQRFRSILAITFTNKAAGEMKERILRELENIRTQGTGSDMGREIAEANKLDDTQLKRYATIVQSAILHNYSDLAVCTIDSFMHRIVRTFAHDLGLPMNFDVQIDNSALIQNAVDRLMALAGTDGQEELTEVLCDFAESKMSDGKSYMVEGELSRLAEELFKENAPEYLASLRDIDSTRFREIHAQMQADNRAYERQMKALGQEGLDTIAEAGLQTTDFYHGTTGAGCWFEKLSKGQRPAAGRYVLDYLEGDKLGSAKTAPDTADRLAEVKPRLAEIHSRICRLRDEGEALYNTRTLLLKNLYSLALMGALNRLVGEYAQENEIVHISEFNKRISDVVRDEPAPFIYERLGNRYRNYLIDEFQDTSRMQWENLVPLVENGIAAGHTSLVVGDGKQAIYRFRQGDVEQFINLPHVVCDQREQTSTKVDSPLHGRLLESPGIAHAERLERNFRTARKVVEFNNDFFQWAVKNRFAENAEMQQIYIGSGEEADLVQQPVKDGGYVQLAFRDLDDNPEAIWESMIADLQRLTEEQGYHYRDILLLARDKQTLTTISEYLTERGIPVVSSESFLLSHSRVVMLLINLLRCLLDGSDKVSAFRVMQHLQALKSQPASPLSPLDKGEYPVGGRGCNSQLSTEGRRPPVGPILNSQFSHLRSLGLYDCCEEALRILDLQGVETAYTATFLGVVARYTQTHRQDLAEFLEWFDEQKDRLSTSTASDLDAVRLMTIHKAKGLESPVVMYPILNKREPSDPLWVHVPEDSGLPLSAGWVQPKKEESTLFDKEYTTEQLKSQLDRINILYVALTRPKERLLVYCQQPPASATNTYNALLRDYVAQRPDFQEVTPQTFALGEDENDNQNDNRASHSSPKLGEVPRRGGGVCPQPSTLNSQPKVGDRQWSQLSTITFPSWTHRIAIARQADELFAATENPDGETSASQSAREYGIQVHEMLSRIDGSETLFKNTEAAKFFDPKYPARREVELIYHGEVLRPDRIVETPDALWVVDFKTGQPRTEHRDQVERYCRAMTEMGYPKVEGYLLYLAGEQCQVMRVV